MRAVELLAYRELLARKVGKAFALIQAAQLVMRPRRLGSKRHGRFELMLRFGQTIAGVKSKGQLFVNFWVLRGELGGLLQQRNGLFRLIMVCEQGPKVQVRLRIRGLASLPRNRLPICRGGFVQLVQSFPCKSEIVFRLNMLGAQLQRLLKTGNRVRELVFVILGPSKEIPGIGIVWRQAGDFGKPLLSIRKVPQQDIVRSNDFQFAGCWMPEPRTRGKRGKRFPRFGLPKIDIPKQEISVRGGWVGRDEAVQDRF